MKVMLVVPHLSDGGGERIVSDLSLGLQADEIVLTVFESRVAYPFKGRLVSLDLPIDRSSLFSRAAGFLRRVVAFRRLVRRERPDAVLSFMGEANLINALVSSRPILSVHNLSGLNSLEAPSSAAALMRRRVEALLSRTLARFLYRRAVIVAVSHQVETELVRELGIPPKQVVVIPNAVNIPAIEQSATDPGLPATVSERLTVITAGRLTAAKGQWHLIRAFAEARKQLPIRLLILGVGELEEYLRKLTAGLGVENDVHFLGWQPNPYKFMTRADVFALPSLSEGFGLVLLEAMACGLPAVAVNCPGPPAEIVAPGIDRESIRKPVFAEYGVVAPAFDGEMRDALAPLSEAEAMFAEVLVQILRDADLRRKYGAASRRRVKDYSHARFIQKYQELIG
jgi:glycosyltransferase involved in cell wall biosynthesis